MPVDDPFDPTTPMLTYAEVRELVARLPVKAQEELAAGPIEEAKQCRACDVFDKLLEDPDDDVTLAAHKLKTWHDDLGRSSWLIERVESRLFPGEVERVNEEEKHLFGCIQYARCCTLYALADLEITLKAAG